MDSYEKMYQAASSNDIIPLDELLEREIKENPCIAENVLSNVCMQLQLNCVHLLEDTKIILERKLTHLRFFRKPKTILLNANDICDRMGFVVELIHNLPTYENNEEFFVCTLIFIVKQISTLKRILKSTYDRIPWEEIEFCVLSYIRTFKDKHIVVLYSRAILNKFKITKYLQSFADHVGSLKEYVRSSNPQELNKISNLNRTEVVDSIINKCPEFKSLYNDYERIRDIYSLNIMLKYAECVKQDTKHNGLLILRALQVIGEHLKNTLESPKLSQTTISFLLASLSDNTRNIIINIRNKLSHNQSLSEEEELLEGLDSDFLSGIKKDIDKIGNQISYILFKFLLQFFKELCDKFWIAEDEKEMREVTLVLKNFQLCELMQPYSFSKVKNDDIDKLKDLIVQFRNKISNETLHIEFFFSQIDDILKNYLSNNSEDFLKSIITIYGLCERFHMFVDKTGDKSNSVQSMKYIMKQTSKSISPQLEPSDLNLVAEIINLIYGCVSEQSEDVELMKICIKIMYLTKYEINSVAWAEKFERKLRVKNQKVGQKKCDKGKIISENVVHEKITRLRKIFGCITFLEYKKNIELQASVEILLLELIPLLKYSQFKSLFMDDAYPSLLWVDLRNHIAHNNVVVDVVMDSSVSVFIFVEKLLQVESTLKNLRLKEIEYHNISYLKKTYFTSISILERKRKMFTALKENNFGLFSLCIKGGTDIRARDIDMSTCLHFAVKKPENLDIIKFLWKNNLSCKLENSEGKSPIHIAAGQKKSEVVKFLLNTLDSEINCVDFFHNTAAHVAALNGNDYVLSLLLDLGADMTIKDDILCFPPLHHAVLSGKVEAVELFFQKNLFHEFNESFRGFTALHIAAGDGLKDMTDYLLSKNVKVNAILDSGTTPLHLAALNGHLQIVNTLINFGADVNSCNFNGSCALHWACETNREEIVKVLIKNGADVNITNYKGGLAPIHYAAAYGFTNIIQILLENNAKVNIATKSGLTTPLLDAVEGQHFEIVELLMKDKAADVNFADARGITPLHMAASKGNMNILRLLMKYEANLNCKDVQGLNPLHYATKYAHEDAVNLLLVSNVSITARTISEELPLHLAVESGSRNIINNLIQKGANINALTSNGSNCLHIAIKNKRNVIDLLLQKRINVDVKTKDQGLTPLHEAVLQKNLEVVVFLSKSGANIDMQDHLGNTAINLAVGNGSLDIFTHLLQNGADITLKNHKELTPYLNAIVHNRMDFLREFLSSGLTDEKLIAKSIEQAIIEGNKKILQLILKGNSEFLSTASCNSEKLSFLQKASMFGKTDIVELLLSYGVDVDSRNSHGSTALSIATTKGYEEIVEILLKNGANVNIQDEEGLTPLHKVSENRKRVIEILLNYGADVNILDKKKRLALELAVSNGYLDSIELLLNKNRDHLNRKGNDDFTLLHIAAQLGRAEIVKFLVEAGANMHSKNNGSKPIHIAARKGFIDVMNIFIENGMSLEVRGIMNNSLLHYAASTGKIDVVKFLIEQGCDVNYENDQGLTPLHVGCNQGSEEVVGCLLNSGAIYNNLNRSKLAVALKIPDKINKMLDLIENLFLSIKEGDTKEIERIIRTGVPLNCINLNKGSPLHYAVFKGHSEVVQILLSHNVLPNIVHKEGWTPLHYAVKYSQLKIALLLLSHGARYDAESGNGKKPVDFAQNGPTCDLLNLINDCFDGVQRNDARVLKRLKGVKFEEIIKAVMSTQNRHGSTLLAAALRKNYPRVKKLEEIIKKDIQIQLYQSRLLMELEKYSEAKDILLSVYEKKKRFLGEYNPVTLEIQSELAVTIYKMTSYKKALEMMENIYQKLKKVLGSHHERTLREQSFIALVLHRLGRNEESLKIFNEVHDIQKQILSLDHNDYLNTIRHMALVLMTMGKYEKALELNNKALKIEENIHSPSHPNTLVIKNNIALILCQQKKNDEASKLFDEVYDLRKCVLGQFHSDTLRTLFNKILILRSQEKLNEALKEFNKLLEVQKEHLGPHHLDTINTQRQIADIYLKQGKLIASFKIFKRIRDHIIATYGINNLEAICIMKEMEAIIDLFKWRGINDNIDSFSENLLSTMNNAAKIGDLTTLENLLRSGVDVNEKDKEGRNTLHFAVDGNNVKVIKLLLEHGVNVTEKTEKLNTSLHTACNKGYKDIVQLLLSSVNPKKLSSFVNAQTKIGKMTALHIAAKQGFLEIVQLLLRKGAVYESVNKDGKKPIDLAIDRNVKNILKVVEDMFTTFQSIDSHVITKLGQMGKIEFLCATSARNSQELTLLQLFFLNKKTDSARKITTMIKEANAVAD